jgi:L,D-peptidoglycan transpeptidase YkuD (ErfK/YbiS/YcfS/YnhG family)
MMQALAVAMQLVLVVSDGWDATHAELRRFERSGDGWHQIGKMVPVALGKRGMAWGRGLHSQRPTKKEGDGRSPAGIFPLGEVYDGVAKICVDDPKSADYNRIVDEGDGEDMRMYRRAIVVGHNRERARRAGSCIFLHDGDAPTVGCTAMDPRALDEIAAWKKEGALIVQLPRAEYRKLKAKWRLP